MYLAKFLVLVGQMEPSAAQAVPILHLQTTTLTDFMLCVLHTHMTIMHTFAGVTTFMTMAYIIVVNPGILGNGIFETDAQDLFPQLAVATTVGSALGTFLMGVLANYPFALAPGMGINAFFTFSVILGLGLPWELALGCVFIEGLIFILITVVDVRRKIIIAIPDVIKLATGAGIGMFIAYIGLSGTTDTGALQSLYCMHVSVRAPSGRNAPAVLC